MAREHQLRPRVSRLEHAVEPIEDRAQPAAAPVQRLRTLVATLLRGAAQLVTDVVQQRLSRTAGGSEQPQCLLEPPPVQVRVQVAEARRQAATHLAVRGRVLAAGQPTAAVTQPEQRVELLDELQRQPPADDRSDRDRVAGRRIGRDLENRILDIEPATDVHQPIVTPGQSLVAGRAQLGDQPALEDQRAELGDRRAVVDDLRLAGPGGRR